MKCPMCQSKQQMFKAIDENGNKVYRCAKCGHTVSR